MSKKYLKLAQQLKKGQSKATRFELTAYPFSGWNLLPISNSQETPSKFDAEGNYISLDYASGIEKARKDKKKKPEVKPTFFESIRKEFNFLCFSLEYTVVKRVA